MVNGPWIETFFCTSLDTLGNSMEEVSHDPGIPEISQSSLGFNRLIANFT